MADEPAIQQAKNKHKLALNIVSMGGSGLNQDANITAMRRAMDIYSDEKHQAEVQKLTQENAALKAELDRERNAKQDVELDYRKVSERLNRMLMEGRQQEGESGIAV